MWTNEITLLQAREGAKWKNTFPVYMKVLAYTGCRPISQHRHSTKSCLVFVSLLQLQSWSGVRKYSQAKFKLENHQSPSIVLKLGFQADNSLCQWLLTRAHSRDEDKMETFVWLHIQEWTWAAWNCGESKWNVSPNSREVISQDIHSCMYWCCRTKLRTMTIKNIKATGKNQTNFILVGGEGRRAQQDVSLKRYRTAYHESKALIALQLIKAQHPQLSNMAWIKLRYIFHLFTVFNNIFLIEWRDHVQRTISL